MELVETKRWDKRICKKCREIAIYSRAAKDSRFLLNIDKIISNYEDMIEAWEGRKKCNAEVV